MIIPPYAKLIGVALAAASIFTFGATVSGWRYKAKIADMKAEVSEARAEAAESNRKIELNALEISGLETALLAKQKEKLVTLKEQVIVKVTEYEKSPVPKCKLAPDWVCAHDTATGRGMPEVPISACGADGAAGTIGDDRALRVVTDNYATCLRNAARFERAQHWLEEQVKNYNGAITGVASLSH